MHTSQLSSGFDWSEEGSFGEKAKNNKREHEDEDESSESETEVSEQVMCTRELRFWLSEEWSCVLALGFHFLSEVCK